MVYVDPAYLGDPGQFCVRLSTFRLVFGLDGLRRCLSNLNFG